MEEDKQKTNEKNESIPQSKISIEELSADDVVETPDTISAIITNKKLVTAGEVFGAKAYDPDTQMIELTVENEEFLKNPKTIYMNYYQKPNDNSKLGKFLKRYGSIKEEKKVILEKDDNGMYELKLEN